MRGELNGINVRFSVNESLIIKVDSVGLGVFFYAVQL